MKHTWNVTFVLIAIFITAQIIGLGIVLSYLDVKATQETGASTFSNLPFNVERPQVEQSVSYLYIVAAIVIGTLLLLLLIKFRRIGLWKLWYFFAVMGTLTIAIAAYLPQYIALTLAIIFALWKILRPNFYVHNLTEILIYGGLAAIFTPILNIFSGVMLLIIISVYDMYAVWKSKHMVKMAEFQSESKLFAGLFVPYKTDDKENKKHKSTDDNESKIQSGKIQTKMESIKLSAKNKPGKVRSAILGGGDIGFPLIFAGVVLKTLIADSIPVPIAFLETMIVVILSALALFILLYKSEKGKFYPAMPFISAGCFLGYIIVWMLNYL